MRKLVTSAAVGAAMLSGAAALTVTTVLPAQAQAAQDGAPAEDGQGARHHRHRIGRFLVRNAAEVIGIEPKALLQELRAGRSVAEVATANGTDPQAVIDALVAKVGERVDRAVAEGRLTPEQAAKIKEKAPERIAKLVNAKRPR